MRKDILGDLQAMRPAGQNAVNVTDLGGDCNARSLFHSYISHPFLLSLRLSVPQKLDKSAMAASFVALVILSMVIVRSMLLI
jgi:hypothetical protein